MFDSDGIKREKKEYYYYKDDPEYHYNKKKCIEECRKNGTLNTEQDCIDFFNTWFNIYKEVRESWDLVN